MTLNTSIYSEVCGEIASSPCSEQNLRRLKDTFKDKINSPRRLSNIRTTNELLRILEKRDELNQTNITCLEQIARILNRHDLLRLMNNGLHPPQINVRVAAPIPAPYPRQAPVLNLQPATARERIHELVINEIGGKWKDLARNLQISEGNIDELEDRYRYVPSDRVREVLLFHERNTPGNLVWFNLLDALSRSRRNDLREEAQRILVHFS